MKQGPRKPVSARRGRAVRSDDDALRAAGAADAQGRFYTRQGVFYMQGAEFEQVYDFGNLYAGFLKARRGKRHKPGVEKFEANLLEALCLLSEMLKTKTYRP